MDAFIELKNVVKSYTMGDVTIYANNGVNFKVNKGEFGCKLLSSMRLAAVFCMLGMHII